MIHVYAIITLLVLSYGYIFRKELLKCCSPHSERGNTTKVILIFTFFSVFCLFLLPLVNYEFPRLALCILLFTMGVYLYWVRRFEKKQWYPFSKIISDVKGGKYSYIIGLCFTLIICGIFCSIISFKTLPLAEGWYSTYAKLINEGELPYRDFELLFPPLYSYIIAFITKIAGYELYVLRIVGIVLFLCLTALQYTLFSKLFRSYSIGTVTATVSALYLQSEAVQIFYDYIRFFDLFAYCATLCLVFYCSNYQNGKTVKSGFSFWITLSGILASLGFLIRQNSGAFVIVYTIILFIGLICVAEKKKSLLLNLLNYCISAAIPIIICVISMSSDGILTIFLNKTTSSAIGAKGGILKVLFAWIPRMLQMCGKNSAMIALILVLIGINYILYRKGSKDTCVAEKNRILAGVFSAAVFTGIVFCYFIRRGSDTFIALKFIDEIPFISFWVVLLLFIYELVQIIHIKKMTKDEVSFHLPYFAVLGMTIAINYGSGTSASLSQGQTALNVGLVLGTLFYVCKHKYAGPIRLTILSASVCLCLSIVSCKYVSPYSWWGLKEGDIRDATYELDIPNARHIKVSESTYIGLQGIYNDVISHSNTEDSIFVFPHAPILYSFTERYPDTYTYVQWFDVSSDDAVIADIETLKENPPTVIVHVHVPESVIISHEDSFRTNEASGLHLMEDMLIQLEQEAGYQLANSYVIQEYEVEVYYLIK